MSWGARVARWLTCFALLVGAGGALAESELDVELKAATGSAADPRLEPVPGPETAEPSAAPPEAPAPTPGPGNPEDVGLDRLLQLPSSMSFDAERRQGATADEWRARFRASRAGIATAKENLEKAKKELDELAGSGSGNWQMAPPGSKNTENSPMSFKLREELRRGREELNESERRLRALIVEADLAGVPEEWRRGD